MNKHVHTGTEHSSDPKSVSVPMALPSTLHDEPAPGEVAEPACRCKQLWGQFCALIREQKKTTPKPF